MMLHFSTAVRAGLVAVCVVMLPNWATAESDKNPLGTPSGPVILTVSGSVEHTNSPRGAEFDYAMLEELGLIKSQIDTIWTEDDAVFEGVLTRELLQLVGASGDWVSAGAVNDYRVSIPLSDLTDYNTLLASSLDGKRMRLRDKGPLWIVYDSVDHPPITQSELNERMVWQLRSLVVR